MIEAIDPKTIEKPKTRCAECDREVTKYNVFLLPDNATRNVCWECLMRQEKGFFAKPNFRRQSRFGIIPR